MSLSIDEELDQLLNSPPPLPTRPLRDPQGFVTAESAGVPPRSQWPKPGSRAPRREPEPNEDLLHLVRFARENPTEFAKLEDYHFWKAGTTREQVRQLAQGGAAVASIPPPGSPAPESVDEELNRLMTTPPPPRPAPEPEKHGWHPGRMIGAVGDAAKEILSDIFTPLVSGEKVTGWKPEDIDPADVALAGPFGSLFAAPKAAANAAIEMFTTPGSALGVRIPGLGQARRLLPPSLRRPLPTRPQLTGPPGYMTKETTTETQTHQLPGSHTEHPVFEPRTIESPPITRPGGVMKQTEDEGRLVYKPYPEWKGSEATKPEFRQTWEERPLTPQEEVIEDARAAKDELAIRDGEPGGYKIFDPEGNVVGGVQSTYPDWYKDLTTVPKERVPGKRKLQNVKGITALTRKQIDEALEFLIEGKTPPKNKMRAYSLVRQAIQGRRHQFRSDDITWEEKTSIEFPNLRPQLPGPTAKGSLEWEPKPVEKSVELAPISETPHEPFITMEQTGIRTERTPGATMTTTVPKTAYRWIDNPGHPGYPGGGGGPSTPSSLQEVLQAPADVTTSTPSRWRNWWNWWKRFRGPEVPTLDAVPTTPVISGVEGLHVRVEQHLESVLKLPWVEKVLQADPETWKRLEAQAVAIWEANGRGPAGYQKAVESLPPEFQEMLKWRHEQFALEQTAKRSLHTPIEGEVPFRPWELSKADNPRKTFQHEAPLLPEFEGPYFPRLTDQEWAQGKRALRIPGQMFAPPNELQSGIATFGKARKFSTMLQGQAEGVKYQDPRMAFLYREVEGAQLRSTEQFLSALQKDGVLFATKEQAQAASPTGKVAQVGGLWARSEEEAEFLLKNLDRKDPGPINAWVHYLNTFVRNPSLVNPFPHLIKNMLYKYGLSGGQFKGLQKDFFQYLHHPEQIDPALLAQFKQVMPFTESGRTIFETIVRAVPKGANPVERAGSVVGRLNDWSSKKIFAEWDPALRYARWKQYVDKGMNPQEAANHVWIDLVRYGTRSDWVDMLKAIPTNFFVPWRVGTVRTLYKAAKSHPFRAAAFVGLVDYLREIDYRKNGRWTHLPIDYIEKPATTGLSDPSKAPSIAVSTFLFGPGGDFTLSSLKNLLTNVQGDIHWWDVKRILWGLFQVMDAPAEAYKALQDGNPEHVANAVGQLLIGRMSAEHHTPERFGRYLPEWLPGMEKSPKVREAEARNDAIAARRARREQMKQRYREVAR